MVLDRERARLVGGAESYRRDDGLPVQEVLIAVAQLRDVIPAEESAEVAEPYQNGRVVAPEIAQPDGATIGVRQLDVGQFVGSLHGIILRGGPDDL